MNISSSNSPVEMFVILLLDTQTLFRFRAEQLIKSRAKLVLFRFLALKQDGNVRSYNVILRRVRLTTVTMET